MRASSPALSNYSLVVLGPSTEDLWPVGLDSWRIREARGTSLIGVPCPASSL